MNVGGWGPPETGMVRYRIEVGRNDGVAPRNIVGAVANEAGIESEFIGPIKIYPHFSTVDLPEGMPKDVFQTLQRTWVSGKQLRIRPDRGPGERRPGRRGPASERKDGITAGRGRESAPWGDGGEKAVWEAQKTLSFSAKSTQSSRCIAEFALKGCPKSVIQAIRTQIRPDFPRKPPARGCIARYRLARLVADGVEFLAGISRVERVLKTN